MTLLDWLTSYQPSVKGAAMRFAVRPSAALLFQRAERPVFALLQAIQQLRSPSSRFLPHVHLVDLPDAEFIVRSVMCGLQHWLHGWNRFGWSWSAQMRRIRDALMTPISEAESLAMSYAPLQTAFPYLLRRYVYTPLPVAEPDEPVEMEIATPPQPSVNVSPAPQYQRLVINAHDMPMTRMDNIRRDRVIARLLEVGRLHVR